MVTRKELLESKEYWLVKIQNSLFNAVENYLEENNKTRSELADQLEVSRGYISQVLNGNFDHRLSTLIDLSLAVGMVPHLELEPLEECMERDNNDISYRVGNEIRLMVSYGQEKDTEFAGDDFDVSENIEENDGDYTIQSWRVNNHPNNEYKWITAQQLN